MINSQTPIQYYTEKLVSNLELLLIPVAMFFAPVWGILITVGAVIFLDTLTGIWKTVKTQGWEFVTSRGLYALVTKLLMSQALILVSYMVGFYILDEVLFAWFSIENLLTKAMALALIGVEVKSIDENYRSVRGIGLWESLKQTFLRAKEFREEVGGVIKKK